MRFWLTLTLAGLVLLAGCGGSGSETPPPVEPTGADLTTYRPPPVPSASPALEEEEQEEASPKSMDVEEEPARPQRRKRQGQMGPP